MSNYTPDQQLEHATDLMRRLPPQNIEANLANLLDLVPDLSEDLLDQLDQPLKVKHCERTGREYLICDYNRDGNSYRSPWSNEYYDPPNPNGGLPPPNLRKLEVAMNDAFGVYRDLYYESEGSVSSVYLWQIPENDGALGGASGSGNGGGFAGVVLIKKINDGYRGMKGAWDSIHVFEVSESGISATYRLTSTVMLYTATTGSTAAAAVAAVNAAHDIRTDKESDLSHLGTMNLSGNLTRTDERSMTVTDGATQHIANIGRMVEDMEHKMRNTLQEVYFGKTRSIVAELRSESSLVEARKNAEVHKSLFEQLNIRGNVQRKPAVDTAGDEVFSSD
ncbi:F-actin capping protein, beta subunit [Ramicandelaber brevisporus]|nr:F-actin capping protein, beta subunit [Ramicandelaber brevisporus]